MLYKSCLDKSAAPILVSHSMWEHMLFSMLLKRHWHPTPVLSPGKSHGRRSLVGCSPGGHEESDMTERLHFHFSLSWLEKEMATHSCSCLENPRDGRAWWAAIYGSHRVEHDWSDLAAAAARCFRVLSPQIDWRFREYRDQVLTLSDTPSKPLVPSPITSDHWPPNLVQCLKKMIDVFVWEALEYMNDHLGLWLYKSEYQLAWYEERGRVFALLPALGVKNKSFIKSLISVILSKWINFTGSLFL